MNVLKCPVCGFDATHVDAVAVAGRAEDGPEAYAQLDRFGLLSYPESVPTGAEAGEGRRHRIALIGSCEVGHEFAIVYTQHKGTTFVETVDLGPSAPRSAPDKADSPSG